MAKGKRYNITVPPGSILARVLESFDENQHTNAIREFATAQAIAWENAHSKTGDDALVVVTEKVEKKSVQKSVQGKEKSKGNQAPITPAAPAHAADPQPVTKPVPVVTPKPEPVAVAAEQIAEEEGFDLMSQMAGISLGDIG